MASALWSQINMTAADGGLDRCLKVANVAATLIANLKGVQKMVTLRDFATSYTEEAGSDGIKGYVRETDKIWQANAATKDSRVERGRLLSAWGAASMAITNLENSPKTDGAS